MKGRCQLGLLVAAAGLAATASPAVAAVGIESAPPLQPSYTPDATDYVTRCDQGSVAVNVRARGGAEVGVDGAAPAPGPSSAEIPLLAGQSFEIVVRDGSEKRRHYVRCLPPEYPEYEFTRHRDPVAEQYIYTPTIGLPRGTPAFMAIFDDYGAPLWWRGVRNTIPLDARVLEDGSIAFAHRFGVGPTDGYEVRGVDGSRRFTVRTQGSPTDHHELIELDNSNYMLLTYRLRYGVDLSPYGGPADAVIYDSEIQEVTREGVAVWIWNSWDHVSLDESRDWWERVIANPDQVEGVGDVYDPTHANSLALAGRHVVISLRHTDAVYEIARKDGRVVWKLGGTTTPASLAPSGSRDPATLFGGQHDARFVPDGTLTVHDNGTGRERSPRAIQFEIDERAATARVIDKQVDPAASVSTCCGSSRLVDGSWVINWGGGTEHATEYGPDGKRSWLLYTPGLRSYRVPPVEPGLVSDAELRAGMDAMSPRRPPECTSEADLLPGPGGTPGADELRGRRDEPEFMRGLAGPDRIDGRAGDDCVLGDGGADRIEGGPGDDELFGGPGDDRVEGGRGADLISCGPGEDLAIVKGGDLVDRSCERVRRAGKRKGGKR